MRSRAFTLLEVVLAIGLTGAVLVLLTTAIELYLMRVDSSRTRVESAQLARTLLTMIADDLRAARYDSSEGESGGGTASDSGGTTSDSDVDDSTNVRGIYGSETELRIDRSAVTRWERVARELDPKEGTTAAQMPVTIQYFLGEGDDLETDDLAAAGVSERPLGNGFAGLYREQTSTISFFSQPSQSAPVQNPTNSETAELLAPEILEVEFTYFDGEEQLSEWDSDVEEGLPTAVEIRLVVLEEPFELAVTRRETERAALRRDENNTVEYRMLVRITDVREMPDAQSPQVSEPQDNNQPGGDRGSSN